MYGCFLFDRCLMHIYKLSPQKKLLISVKFSNFLYSKDIFSIFQYSKEILLCSMLQPYLLYDLSICQKKVFACISWKHDSVNTAYQN
jgi:hypothetical protein